MNEFNYFTGRFERRAPLTGQWYREPLGKPASFLSSIGRDPVWFDPLSPKPLGRQVMDQLNPSPHMPLYPFRIGPLG